MALERDSVTLLHLSDTQFGRNHRFGNLRATTEDGKFETLIKRTVPGVQAAPEENNKVFPALNYTQ